MIVDLPFSVSKLYDFYCFLLCFVVSLDFIYCGKSSMPKFFADFVLLVNVVSLWVLWDWVDDVVLAWITSGGHVLLAKTLYIGMLYNWRLVYITKNRTDRFTPIRICRSSPSLISCKFLRNEVLKVLDWVWVWQNVRVEVYSEVFLWRHPPFVFFLFPFSSWLEICWLEVVRVHTNSLFYLFFPYF